MTQKLRKHAPLEIVWIKTAQLRGFQALPGRFKRGSGASVSRSAAARNPDQNRQRGPEGGEGGGASSLNAPLRLVQSPDSRPACAGGPASPGCADHCGKSDEVTLRHYYGITAILRAHHRPSKNKIK